jgi:serine/threonine protein kinase
MKQLKVGDTVTTDQGTFKVMKCIGEGGQGKVYRIASDGKAYALKWFHQALATQAQFTTIETLVEMGAPDGRFIWPISIAQTDSEESFGYVMPLIDQQKYQKLTRYFSGEITFEKQTHLIEACMQLVHSFYALHMKGLCYRDISFGNIFVELATGNIQICDNDNVTYDNLTSPEDNWGTYGFMAPEIVRGEAPPSTTTDLFSLSVVLFRMLYKQHPLQGRREVEIDILDEAANQMLYGQHPVFIFDPIDETNRPVKNIKDIAVKYWEQTPDTLNDLFVRAFTEGLTSPEYRVRESEWMKALTILKGQLLYCTNCGKERYYHPNDIKIKHQLRACPHCGTKQFLLPPRMKLEDRVIMLNHDTVLSQNQLRPLDMEAYLKPFARVIQHPRHPNIWGLKNASDDKWTYHKMQGEEQQIEREGVIPMKQGLMIDFNGTMGLVRLSVKQE